MNRLALGTAQFGMDYGINNKRGKVPRPEVFEILESARRSGIDTLDTASSYGESEKVIGEFIRSDRGAFRIVSKLPVCRHQEVADIFESSLKDLGLSEVYGYLVHSFPGYKDDEKIWDELESLRLAGRVKKIGFSLYSPGELEYLIDKGLKIDIIQLPFSIFDQRFERYLPALKESGVEIHARSVFLQGLVFKKPGDLDINFRSITDKLAELNRLADDSGLSIVSLCVDFVLANECIDKAVVGVDNPENLSEIVKAGADGPVKGKILQALLRLKVEDEKIILPFNWKPSKANN